MSGEDPAIRRAVEEQKARLQASGMSEKAAADRARQSGLSVERKLERGDLTDPRKLKK